jgi:hypothetical protein
MGCRDEQLSWQVYGLTTDRWRFIIAKIQEITLNLKRTNFINVKFGINSSDIALNATTQTNQY